MMDDTMIKKELTGCDTVSKLKGIISANSFYRGLKLSLHHGNESLNQREGIALG